MKIYVEISGWQTSQNSSRPEVADPDGVAGFGFFALCLLVSLVMYSSPLPSRLSSCSSRRLRFDVGIFARTWEDGTDTATSIADDQAWEASKFVGFLEKLQQGFEVYPIRRKSISEVRGNVESFYQSLA